MKKILGLLCSMIPVVTLFAQQAMVTGAKGEKFSVKVVADKLSDPWEVTFGPDNNLWITEGKGYRVLRIDPSSGVKNVLIDLKSERHFPRYDKMGEGKPWPQGGLMGMALHPQLLTGKPYVYLSFVYKFEGADKQGDGCLENLGGCIFRTKIVRYSYDISRQKLLDPSVIIDTLPGSSDHNAGRLAIAPVNGKDYLFYSIGDMGAGQLSNAGRPNHAQQKEVYEGKVLRFNTEPDSDKLATEKWIPNDNPFNTTTQSAVWTLGHRNPQGLVYAVVGNTGRLFSSEHGPYSDDEINIIEKGKNYGHPLIIGFNDGNYNGLAAAATSHTNLPGVWHTTYPTIVSEQDNAAAIGIENYKDPIKTFYPLSNNFLKTVLTRTRDEDPEKPIWQSEAPSSIDVYTSSTIPGWKNSLLIPALKTGKLIRLQLNANGDGITGDTITYFKALIRYRDIAISKDGSKIYLATDSTSSPKDSTGNILAQRGVILELTYIPATGKGATKVNQPAKSVGTRKEN